MMATLRLATAGMLAVALVACGDGGSGNAECGNQVCETGENHSSCPSDCSCGNGSIDEGEECDGDDVGTATCDSQGRGAGSLICNSDCTFNYSGCDVNDCGDGTAQAGEDCDGSDLSDATCESLGFSVGDLSCNDNCTFDASSCCNSFCDNVGDTRCDGEMRQECVMASSGCLVWDTNNCADTGYVCEQPEGEAAACVCFDTCSVVDSTRCNSNTVEVCVAQKDGCLKWQTQTDCFVASGQTCAMGPDDAVCVPMATGEDCSDPFPLSQGVNVVAWDADNQDYLTSGPSCSATSPNGADVVMKYTASSDGFIDVVMDKPTNNRFHLVASSSACGTTTPELLCVSEYSGTSQGGSFSVSSGTDYFLYAVDSTSGSYPLPNPLIITVTENDCATFDASPVSLTPAHQATPNTLSPTFSVEFNTFMNTTVGTVSITGDMGTNLSYDLSTAPTQITWSNDDKTMTIDTGSAFPAGETLTISWSGMRDVLCDNVATPPAWTVYIQVPSCTPGVGGVVGTTETRITTATGSLSEYYVVADDDPNGWVYVGGTSSLKRVPKAGGAVEDVYALASLGTTNVGYDMLVVGDNIFTLDSTTTTVGRLYRISSNGGTSWNVQDFASFATAPADDFRGMTHYDGRIYLVTQEGSSGVGTQIWSVDANPATVPTAATLEGTIPGELYCTGIAADDNYFYLTCATGDRVVRVSRTTFMSELIADPIYLTSTSTQIYADDLDADGTADVLYFHGYHEYAWYICDPAGTPFVDELANFGGSTSNYGMGFDPVAKTLWFFDDDTNELVRFD